MVVRLATVCSASQIECHVLNCGQIVWIREKDLGLEGVFLQIYTSIREQKQRNDKKGPNQRMSFLLFLFSFEQIYYRDRNF